MADVAAEADQLVAELMLDPAARADPYSRYRRLRDAAPVHRVGFAPMWFCTRYDDCREVLRDPRMVSPPTVLPGDEERAAATDTDGPFQLFGRRQGDDDPIASRSLLRLNPPDHTRLRGLVSRGFTPRRIEALRPAVAEMTDGLLSSMAEAGDVDLLDALAFPLPVMVIGELVGVPSEDRDQFRKLVRTSATVLEPGVTDEQIAEAQVTNGIMQDYFADLIADRGRDPRDDLTSALIAARDDSAEGDRLSEAEMIATLILIFAAGFETTTNLIGNGLYTLLRHPDELRRLRAQPELVPVAVEELLRYESPVQLDARRVAEDADVAGRRVPAGDWVVTFLGSANRDPARFDDPETFRIAERATPVLSFASGIHYCLGASLARLEGQEVFAALLRRFGSIELRAEPTWRDTLTLRGLDGLAVSVS